GRGFTPWPPTRYVQLEPRVGAGTGVRKDDSARRLAPAIAALLAPEAPEARGEERRAGRDLHRPPDLVTGGDGQGRGEDHVARLGPRDPVQRASHAAMRAGRGGRRAHIRAIETSVRGTSLARTVDRPAVRG